MGTPLKDIDLNTNMPLPHDHEGEYAEATHPHADKADTVHAHPENAPAVHTHVDKADALHTHILTDLPHVHNQYSPTTHDHNTAYSATNHTHPASQPAAHKTTHATGGTDAIAPSDIGAATSGHTHALQAPQAHAASHASGGGDAITPAAIGAALSAHNHDSTYFTEAEVTTLLSGKADSGHTHAGGGSATPRESLEASWGASIIKTNIGASFVDVYNQAGADGKSVQIDTTDKTEVKLMVLWNKIGTGTHTVQVLEVGTANVLISLNVVSGRNVSALTAIPAFAANSVKFYKLQCKSTTAADDPVFEGARVYLK